MDAVDAEPAAEVVWVTAGSPPARAWGWFAAWAATGAVASFGVIALMTIGLPLLVISGGASAWLLTRRAESRVGVWGLLSGASVAAGFLVWTNRDGPGDVCHTTATETSCQQEWNPIPFAVVAAILLFGGIAAFVIECRRVPRQLVP
jgi:hypothetical protein